MASPKIGPSFFGKNYERYVSELTTEGTIAGEKLTPEERKEGFKTKDNKINFKNFLEKVLERLPSDAQNKITEGQIGRVNFDRYARKISANDVRKNTSVDTESQSKDLSKESVNINSVGQVINPEQLFGIDDIEPEESISAVKSADPEKLVSEIIKTIDSERIIVESAKSVDPEKLVSEIVKIIDSERIIIESTKSADPEKLATSIVKVSDPEKLATSIVKVSDPEKISSELIKTINYEKLVSEIIKIDNIEKIASELVKTNTILNAIESKSIELYKDQDGVYRSVVDPKVKEVVVESLNETIPDGLDDLLKDISDDAPAGLDDLIKSVREEEIKPKKDDKILANIKETNKNLLETNEILYGLIKSLQKEMIEEKKRAFKEKDRLRKEERKASFGSAVVKSGSGRIAKGKKSPLKGGGLFDNPLFKFLGLSALAGLVEFIPKIVEFVETLPEKINKFFTKDVPDFIGKKFEEFKNLVGGFFTDRFNEVKQFFEDIYTGIDDFTGGRLTEFIEGIKGLGPMIVEKSQEFYKTIDDWTGGRISGAFDWIGKNVIDPLGAFFTEKIDYVKGEAGKLWENFSSSFLNFFGDIKFELPDLGITELVSNTLGLEPAAETGPDLTQDLVAVGGTTAANIAPISGATGMAVEGMDAAQVANQIPNMNVGGKSVQLGTGLSQGGTGEDVQKQISGLREGGAKGVQVLGTGDAEKDATLQEIVSQNKDFATFLPAVKSDTGGIDYQATAAAGAQQIQDGRTSGPGDPNSAQSKTAQEVVASMGFTQPDFDTFKGVVAQIESGGKYDIKGGSGDHYDGRYQLGAEAKSDAAKYLGVPDPGHTPESRQRFREDSEMQERFFAAFTKANHTYLMGNPEYRDASPRRKLQILGYAHNQGMGGAEKWMTTGEVGADGFGTKGTKYTDEIRKAFASAAPQQRQPQRSAQPVSAALTGTLDKIDSGEMAHTTSGTRKPSVVSTSAVIPNRDSISVTSRRGMRTHPVTGGEKMHQGTDISAPSGTPLYAFTDALITDRGHDSGYGNYIAWKDSFGSEHLYAHMTQMSANIGDTVKAGTVIGKSGGGVNDPGRGTSTGAHLHWEYGPVGETGRNGAGLVDPLDKFDYMMPFGAKKIISSPEPTPTPAPKPTSITAAPSRIQAAADAVSRTPSRASRSRVSNINLPAEVRNNPIIAGSSGGQSSSTENYVPRVSTRTSSDIYQINTRALFNIVG